MEAALLGGFMVSACLFSVVLFHPGWPAARLLPDPLARRALMGLAMGATAIALNYSAWANSRARTTIPRSRSRSPAWAR